MKSEERLRKQIANHLIKDKIELKIENFNLIIYPGVFIPNGSSSLIFSHFFNKFDEKFERVLDMGCGSGIISLLISKYSKEVIAADINPVAVQTTKENAERNNINNIIVKNSDLFGNISGKFDLILFNPPFMGLKPNTDLEKAFTDNNHETLIRFFEQVPKHLNKNGKIILEFANMDGEKLLNNLIKDYSKRQLYEENFKDFAGVKTHYYILELTKHTF